MKRSLCQNLCVLAALLLGTSLLITDYVDARGGGGGGRSGGGGGASPRVNRSSNLQNRGNFSNRSQTSRDFSGRQGERQTSQQNRQGERTERQGERQTSQQNRQGERTKDRGNGKPIPVKGNAAKDRGNGRTNAPKEPIPVKGNAPKDRGNGSSRLAIANRTVRTLLTIIATVTGVVAVGTVAVITSPRVGVGWV